jgi:hypothetical protein
MAAQKTYLKNPAVFVDGHDWSTYVKGCTVTRNKAQLDVTASGDGGTTDIHGLSKDTFAIDLYQDQDFSLVERVLSNLYEAESVFVVEVVPRGSTVASTNPSYIGNCKLYADVVGGQVGAVLESPVTFAVQGAITRSGT